MIEKEETNGSKKFLLEELRAVRSRADRLQKNLEDEQTINRTQHEKNQLINYRVDKLEKVVEEIQHSVKNIEEFVTSARVQRGASWADIGKIAVVVSVVLGGVFTAIISTLMK